MISNQQMQKTCEFQQNTELKKKKKSSQRKRRLKWTNQQNLLYLKFIQQQKATLQLNHKGQKQFIYNKMAKYIMTRNSRNCKSHHQKLLKRFKNIENILKVQDRHGKIQNFGRKQPISSIIYQKQNYSSTQENISADSQQIKQAYVEQFKLLDSQIFIEQDSEFVFPEEQNSLYGILEI